MSNKFDTIDKIVSHVMFGFSPDDFAHFQGITLEAIWHKIRAE
jgi:hypothetical protein